MSSLRMARFNNQLVDKRLTGVSVNGSSYIEDAYIYRLYEAKKDSPSPTVHKKNAVAMA